MAEITAKKRVLSLEALRGIAAVLMVVYHFSLGYLPRYMGILPPFDASKSLVGSLFYAPLNGHAMLVTFFVLSGYVLSFKGLKADPVRAIADAAFKRWFRFLPLLFMAMLISWLFFYLHLYHFDAASALSDSYILSKYVAHGAPDTWRPPFATVIYEGFIGTLLLGKSSLDSAMWTMQVEFYGSFMVFALALLLASTRRWWLWGVLPVVAIVLFREAIWFLPLLVGFIGVMLRLDRIQMGRAATFILLMAAFYLCGYYDAQGWYKWFSIINIDPYQRRMLVLNLDGFLLLALFATCNPFSRQFDGLVSRILGRTAFALYLLHMLILSSFCSWVYVALGGTRGAIIAAAFTFLITAPPFVYVLARIDIWWLHVLGRWHPLKGRA